MPWGDNQDNNNKGPWGNKPASTKVTDFDQLLKKSQSNVKRWLGNGSGGDLNNPRLFLLFLLAAAVLWLFTGFYIVEPEEEAVILRFGKYDRIAKPGLNYHIPAPVELAIKQKVTRIEREEIGFRSTAMVDSLARNQRSAQRNIEEESLMLTGDENIVDINFEVQWRIRDLKEYLFNVYRPKDTVKSAAESAMREVISNTPIAAALAEGRFTIERKTRELLQQSLDSYHIGVEIVQLQMLKVDPPSEVVDAFRDVQTARADKEREINQSQAYQNDIIPRARGEAERIIQEAEAYRQEVVARAEGEANRFSAIYEQYKGAKDITRKRLYLETMEDVLKGMDKVILDSKSGTVPYLPLPEIAKKRTNQ